MVQSSTNMLNRFFYQLNLEEYRSPSTASSLQVLPSNLIVRSPEPDDIHALATLMLAAYSGTIDDDGGILEDAIAEVQNYLQGEYGTPLLLPSRVAVDSSGQAIAAVLITRWGELNLPLIAFVMTTPLWQGKKLAQLLMRQSITALKEANEQEVQAVITARNIRSERLFRNAKTFWIMVDR